jgi:copper chaperone CopZ
MIHKYIISGMTCSGCENKVQTDLAKTENITDVEVSKENGEAIITMSRHVELDTLQEAIGGKDSKYQISLPNDHSKEITKTSCCSTENKEPKTQEHKHNNQPGKYYCPMHCEGDKVYDKAGDCPVCGMDLVKEPTHNVAIQYTCPMYPEIIRDEPGSCPM